MNNLSLHKVTAINVTVKKNNSITTSEYMYDVIHIEVMNSNNDIFTISNYGENNIDIPIQIQVKTNKEQ